MLTWLVRLACLRFLRGPDEPAVVSLSVQRWRFTLNWAASEHIPLREILLRGEYWPEPSFYPSLGETIVDAGANAGVYSTVAGSYVGPAGRVIAIEPNPVVLPRLRENIRQNGLSSRCTIVEAGSGEREEAARLLVTRNTTVASVAAPADASKSVPIRLTTLDLIAEELGLDTIDLLKIDIEGLEAQALAGARRTLPHCRRVVVETSHALVDEVEDRLKEASFDRIVRQKAGPDSMGQIVLARRT